MRQTLSTRKSLPSNKGAMVHKDAWLRRLFSALLFVVSLIFTFYEPGSAASFPGSRPESIRPEAQKEAGRFPKKDLALQKNLDPRNLNSSVMQTSPVFCPPGTGYCYSSISGFVTVDSSYNTYNADRALSPGGDCVSGSGNYTNVMAPDTGGDAWAIFDLGQVFEITKFTSWDLHNGWWWLEYSEDKTTWGTFASGLTGWFNEQCTSYAYDISAAPARIRYIRYRITQQTYIGNAYRVAWFSFLSNTPATAENTPTLTWSAESDQAFGLLGQAISATGDFNGDGKTDLAVGAPAHDPTPTETDAGVVWIYYGSADGFPAAPSLVLTTHEAGARFGWAVSSAGDVDGDGKDDLLVGATGCSHPEMGEGCAYLYLGSSGGLNPTPVWSLEGNQAHAALGYTVGSAGNVNGDTYADIFVAAPNYSNGESNEGVVYVYQGSSTGVSATPIWAAEGNQANAVLGLAVSSAGDVNNDSYGDLIVGAPNYSNDLTEAGKALVYLGSSTGLATTPDWTMEGNQAFGHFGEAVSAGDVNGDGFGDVAVGAADYDSDEVDEGAVFVYLGSATGLGTQTDWMGDGNQVSANYGISISLTGDVNGDGYADLLIGSNRFDQGEENEGKVSLYYGSSAGVESTPAWVVEGDQSFAGFGYAVCTVGDVNGDGSDDILMGIPQWDHEQVDEGQVLLFYGTE